MAQEEISVAARKVDTLDVYGFEMDADGKLIRDMATGKPKQKLIIRFDIIEPSAKKLDEYMKMTAAIGQEIAETHMGLLDIDEKIQKYLEEPHSDEEIEAFKKKVEADTNKITEAGFSDNREIIEFIVGKISDHVWDEHLTTSIRRTIIEKFETLCDMEQIQKNLQMLLPPRMALRFPKHQTTQS